MEVGVRDAVRVTDAVIVFVRLPGETKIVCDGVEVGVIVLDGVKVGVRVIVPVVNSDRDDVGELVSVDIEVFIGTKVGESVDVRISDSSEILLGVPVGTITVHDGVNDT